MIAKILKYDVQDMLRNRWILAYSAFFFLMTFGLYRFGGGMSKVLISLMNVVLIVIPLVSIIFGTIYVYSSREFLEVLLANPIPRKKIFFSKYFAGAITLGGGFLLGAGIPLLSYTIGEGAEIMKSVSLLIAGFLLTLIFLAIAMWISFSVEDKAKGLGLSLVLWFFFSVMYDGILLFLFFLFTDYPLEKSAIAMSFFNPIDLARIFLSLNFDISALMGYTGAVYQMFLGNALGKIISAGAMAFWTLTPLYFALRMFRKKDF